MRIVILHDIRTYEYHCVLNHNDSLTVLIKYLDSRLKPIRNVGIHQVLNFFQHVDNS